MKSFYRLKGFLWENKWSYLLGFIWLLIVDSFQLIFPLILKAVTDELQNNLISLAGLIKYAIYIVLTGLVIGFGRYFWRIYIVGNSRKLEYQLRKELFNHLLILSPNYFNTHKTGDLMSHATNDINSVRMALGFGIIMTLDSIFIIILALISMARVASLKLTLIAIVNLPLIVLLTRRFGNAIYNRSKNVQEAFSNLTDMSQESFSGIRVIKSFTQEDLVTERFKGVNQDNLDKNLKLVKVSGSFRPLLEFIFSISLLITIFYGGKEAIKGNISLGDFIAFNAYLGLLNWPTRAIGQVINVLQRGSASMDRLNAILDEKPEILDSPNAISAPNLAGEIEFKEVSFKYPGSKFNALTDINFKLKKGDTLAIVGRTGSGKTTILNLLLRLYNLHQGEILIDGLNIDAYSLKSLRENIAYVPQDSFLFSKSIRENIGFAFDKELDIKEIHQAAKLSDLYENIIEFPQAFETILGERGVTLSGGQRQRTSIARALIKDSPLLILDDSLSAVDTETEDKILNNIKKYAQGTSTIIVSHRISTVQFADEIIFLDGGRIIERGNHKQLLDYKGAYKDLYDKQLLEEKIRK